MSAELLQEIRHLRQEIANIAAIHSPWIGMDEMQSRYGCCLSNPLRCCAK